MKAYTWDLVDITDTEFAVMFNYTGAGSSPFSTPTSLTAIFNLTQISTIWSHSSQDGLNATATILPLTNLKTTKDYNACLDYA